MDNYFNHFLKKINWEGSHQYELLKHAEATLGSGNLRMAVMLPEGEDLNEWVAVNSKENLLWLCIFFSALMHEESTFFLSLT
uniref:Uncharacterized protein n=1 Tax=Laticauda laticaudata TaxID=8630 RepID=A0A8C5RAZ9_LATLA